MKKFALSLFTLLPALSYAFSYSGNVKTFPIYTQPTNGLTGRKSWQNKALIQLNTELPNEIKAEAAYELTTTTEKTLPHKTPKLSYRVKDLNYYLHDADPGNKYSTTIIQNLNRLNLNFKASLGDVVLGRVPVAFGSSKAISPVDVLTPFAPNTIDKEERTGVDALILKTPLTSSLLLESGFVAGEKLKTENSAFYLRPKLTVEKWDATFTYLNFKKNNLLGIELLHPISDAGFWVEYAYLDENLPGKKDFSRATTGVDYKFQNSLYLAFEYHFNGSSKENGTIYPEDFIYLANKHYFILTSSYEFTPLLTGQLQNFFENRTSSALTAAKLDYNLTENSWLTLGCFLGSGNSIKSEFGRYGRKYYGTFKFYF